MTFMGLHKWWQVTWVIVFLSLSSLVEGSNAYDHESLDAFFCKHASTGKGKPTTGFFYNVSLPSNFTGMEVSVVRLRTVSFWLRGLNHSYLNLPPRIVPQPNRKRMAILYENFGNWSSHYYHVPNYTMVAPVFGFMAYSSSEKAFINCEKMNLTIQGDPITIRFPHVLPLAKNVTPICAKFVANGSVEFTNMTKPYLCEAQSQGHYTLVVPSPKAPPNQGKKFAIWWVLGFVIGFVGLVMLALVLLAIVKAAKKRKLRKMEKVSEGGEAFDTFWIGESKLPLATMIRTQPALEHDDVIR